MAAQHHTTEPDDSIDVWITPTIDRDYRRRNVFFPEMWSEDADKILSNGTFVHEGVCLEFAQELLEDAKEQRCTPNVPRGTRVAYTALMRQIEGRLRALLERATVPDPGYEAMLKPLPSPARFNIGDAAVVWAPGKGRHGILVEIVGEYKLLQFTGGNGGYLTKNGDRVSYRYGYIAKIPGDDRYAFPPHELRAPDGSVRHIRLV